MEKKMDTESLNLLKQVGLNQYESKLYLALLSTGPISASDSAAIAGIPRPRAYDVLEKLEKRGFIVSQPGRPVKFAAAPLNEAFNRLKTQKEKEHKQQLQNIAVIEKQLSERLMNVGSASNVSAADFVWVIKDQQNIHSKIDSLLTNAQDEIYISAPEKQLKDKLEIYSNTLKKASDRGVKIKINSPNASPQIMKQAGKIAHSIAKKQTHRMIIADDEMLLFLTPEDSKQEVVSWIRSPYFANNMKKLF